MHILKSVNIIPLAEQGERNEMILIVDRSAFFLLLIASMLLSSCSKNNYLLKAQCTYYVVLEKTNLIH